MAVEAPVLLFLTAGAAQLSLHAWSRRPRPALRWAAAALLIGLVTYGIVVAAGWWRPAGGTSVWVVPAAGVAAYALSLVPLGLAIASRFVLWGAVVTAPAAGARLVLSDLGGPWAEASWWAALSVLAASVWLVHVRIPFGPPRPEGASAGLTAEGPVSTLPQWIQILDCLAGSSAESDGRGEQAWTQKAIAERVGAAPARVSEFPALMNQNAARRLDAYVPGWREGAPREEPILVVRQRGVVRGASGVWTYYRLTPLGERLREAVSGPGAATASPAAR